MSLYAAADTCVACDGPIINRPGEVTCRDKCARDYHLSFPANRKSFVPTYESGCRCPACRKSHWHLGSFSAECAFCGFTMQLERGNRG